MQNNKVIKLTKLLIGVMLALALAACNVGPLVPPAEKLPVNEKTPIIVRVSDMPDNCVAIKEAKITLTDPSGSCTTQVWKSCEPTAISFDFKESGCYKFCVEITGNNGAKFYYSGSFPLDLKEKYNVEVAFVKGVITVVFTKIDQPAPKKWNLTAIPGTSDYIKDSIALSFAPDGSPSLLYRKESYYVTPLNFLTKNGSEWSKEVVEKHGYGISEKAISYDSSGNPLLAYSHPLDNRILLSKKVGTTWTPTKVDFADFTIGEPLSVKDSLNRLHIIYWKGSSSSGKGPILRYKLLDDRLGYVTGHYGQGYPVTLEVDSNNALVYIYYTKEYITGPNHKTVIKYYYRATEKGIFINEQLDIDTAPVMAVNSKDMTAIAYFNNRDKKLYYAARVNGKWEVETVENAGLTYGKCSLIFDSSDRPVIAYYDTVNMDLKVATKTVNGWVSTTVDSEGDVGQACNIRLNNSQEPVVVYFDKTAKAIKLAELK